MIEEQKSRISEASKRVSELELLLKNNRDMYEAKIAILNQNIKEYSDVTHELMSLHQKKAEISEKKSEGLQALATENFAKKGNREEELRS